jgi:hypothetical protein
MNDGSLNDVFKSGDGARTPRGRLAYRHGWMAWRVGMGMAGMWWHGDPVASGGGRTATALQFVGDVAGHAEVAG